MGTPSSVQSEPIRGGHFAGLFLLSLATLLLELSLTRVLSVSLWYHFGFLVISTALLGFGASGVVLALWTGLRERKDLDFALTVCGLAFAASVVFSFWCMQRVPFDPFSVAVDQRQFFYMPLYFLLVALPFFCSGLAISLLLTRGSTAINRLYGYDLLGAGAGCALVAVVIPRFGGTGSVLLAAFVGAVAAACFAWSSRRVFAAGAAVIAVVLLAGSFRGDRVIPIHVSANKTGRRGIHAIYSAWNTLSLVQVVEYPAEDKDPAARMMFIDAGTAATGITDLRPDVRKVLAVHPDRVEQLSTIAYAGKANPKILIIGSGGGDQVLAGLASHASSITAVEINPIVNDIVASRMNDFWGNLYHQPEVHLVTDEGRSFVRRSTEKYDAIISVHTISNAAVASGALSLAESYVLTREAFEDYLDHLTPDGTIFFTRPEFQIPRLVSTAREVFTRRGLGSIENHVIAFSEPGQMAIPGRPAFVAGFLLKKSPFTAADVQQIRAILKKDVGEQGPGLKALYFPDERPADSLSAQIVGAAELEDMIRNNDVELQAATDDKPFFNQHTRWSRIRWGTIVDLFSQKGPMAARMALEDRPIAEVTLLILLVQSAVVAGLFILLPLLVMDRRGLQMDGHWGWLAYFAALGLGFIMVEIALLQRFLLFLGQPIYTYAVVLAGLLIFSGIGSSAAGKWKMELERAAKAALIGSMIVLLVMAVLTPVVFRAFLGLEIAWRIVIAMLLVAPLGFVLGMPFPLGLRMAMQRSSALGSWAWGVNGFFTVIGTVLALMLGMMIGFRIVLLLACACYLSGFLALSWVAGRKAASAA